MKKIFALVLILNFYNTLYAQNLFPQNVDNCDPESFCLDCGDIKANFDLDKFNRAKVSIEEKYKNLKGTINFQMIINTKGKACVLSHTDATNNPLTQELVVLLNNFDGWICPTFKEKKEDFVSFIFSISISNGKLEGKVERIDMKNFMEGFDYPLDPEIENTSFVYKNEHLNQYTFEIWNKTNSENPNNMNDNVAISTNGHIWYTLDEGLIRFDGKNFIDAKQTITNSDKYFTYYDVAADKNGRTWVATTEGLYYFEQENWTKLDSSKVGFKDINKIVVNRDSNEVFFCTDNGLFIYKNEKWQRINRNTTPELPTNKIEFATRDSKGRIWMGTFKGSIMIEEHKVSVFNKAKHLLNGQCILALDENENGTLFMCLYDYKKKGAEKTNDGIASYDNSTNQWRRYTVSNSGLPVNSTESLLVDKDNIVWIVTATAGLVRFDPRIDLWENYNNRNSPIPTSFIMDIEEDREGRLILGTRQGIVRLSKK